MAFRIGTSRPASPDDPESLLRDLRKKTIPGLLSHQADLLRSYLDVHTKFQDIALQLPTGSGKTLVGLLIGEWRRRKYGERVVYLCPTNQLVHQVASQATAKYGMDVHAFAGSKALYAANAAADWRSAEAIAVTNYSSLFNTNPFFDNANVIILDDAHSAENYIANYWSLLVDRTRPEHEAAYSALLGVITPLLPPSDRSRLAVAPRHNEDRDWVEKLPTPALQGISSELVALLDEHTTTSDLRYQWRVLRDSLHACHLYLSRRAVLIRPLIPPSNTHGPFADAKQRIYMSATLGAGGDLERISGRFPIHRIPVPTGWDKQGIGRRFFVFPQRALDDEETQQLVLASIKLARRALYLVPDGRSAEKVSASINTAIGYSVFNAAQLEESKKPFIESEKAVAVVANRYDGIDLVDDDCRLLFVDGLPGGANLQERFFVLRITARLLLDDRILTRLVQGFGRCTRSPNDYAAVVVLGESRNRYLFAREPREFFHPEIQAELEFGLQESKDATVADMLDNLNQFLKQSSEWDKADQAILSLRSHVTQRTLPATAELAGAVGNEIAYQYALWNRDFNGALEHCRTVIGKLTHPDLRGYRALWLYLAGSAARQAYECRSLETDEVAKDYFRQAQAAAPVVRWLVALQVTPSEHAETRPAGSDVSMQVERLEVVLEELGTVHDRKYDAEESQILREILQSTDGELFEHGHERLGRLLGFDAGNSTDEGAPDPWWIVDDSLCFVFEDHAEGKRDTQLSVTKARQAASHPEWIRANLNLREDAQIIPVLITPCTRATKGAMPHLKSVRYWPLENFRQWAKTALGVIRELRRDFPGSGHLAWRSSAATKMNAANIGPTLLKSVLTQSAAEAIEEKGDEENA